MCVPFQARRIAGETWAIPALREAPLAGEPVVEAGIPERPGTTIRLRADYLPSERATLVAGGLIAQRRAGATP